MGERCTWSPSFDYAQDERVACGTHSLTPFVLSEVEARAAKAELPHV
jgi:hypothetical protein